MSQIFKEKDDYEWQSEYPTHHYSQTLEIINKKEDFYINGDSLPQNIHENQRLLYQFCIEQKPKTVFEVGFGYGNHLINISKLLKGDVALEGCDISIAQYNNAKTLHDISKYNIKFKIGDFLDLKINKKYNLVYSNAVVMHMSTERAKLSIEKMCQISDKYVLLIDGGLAIDNVVQFCEQFGEVKTYDEFWQTWSYNYTVPILINVKNGER